MLLFWCMLLLSASCSGSEEIPIDRAVQSSTYSKIYSADRAFDNDLTTCAATKLETRAWLRLYFKSSSNVGKVETEKGMSLDVSCTYSVSVYKGEVKTLCGTYTGKRNTYYNETVQCDGKRGDSVMLEMTGCTNQFQIYEIKVYSPGKCTATIKWQ